MNEIPFYFFVENGNYHDLQPYFNNYPLKINFVFNVSSSNTKINWKQMQNDKNTSLYYSSMINYTSIAWHYPLFNESTENISIFVDQCEHKNDYIFEIEVCIDGICFYDYVFLRCKYAQPYVLSSASEMDINPLFYESSYIHSISISQLKLYEFCCLCMYYVCIFVDFLVLIIILIYQKLMDTHGHFYAVFI